MSPTRRTPITLALAVALAFTAFTVAPVTAETPSAATNAAVQAAKWKDVRRNCHQKGAGKVCLRTQRKGHTNTWRAKLTVKARHGKWIRPADEIYALKTKGLYPAPRAICSNQCPKVKKKWSSKWVRAKRATGAFSTNYATPRKDWIRIQTGRIGRRKKSSMCTTSGRVCVALYSREIDDRVKWQARVALTPESGRWIAPVKLVLKPKGTKKKVVRTFNNAPRTSRWTARAGDLAGNPVGTVARFTYRTDRGTFTLKDTYEGRG